MKQWILGLKIRVKLLAAFGSILLFSILLVVLSVNSITQVINNKNKNEKLEMLKLAIASQELAIQEFIAEGFKEKGFQEFGQSPLVNSFDENYAKASVILKELNSGIRDTSHMGGNVFAISQSLQVAALQFDSLKNLLKTRGFKDYGLEGSLRKVIHEIENSELKINKAELLTLRRNEKDFFLRKDLKYKDDFIKNAQLFRASISKLNDPLVSSVLQKLDAYRDEFLKVIELEVKIGLKTNEGIRGKLFKEYSALRGPLEKFSTVLRDRSENQITVIIYILWLIFTVQLMVGILLAIFYADLITKAIKEIRDAMQTLANGFFPEKLTVRTTEEIGQTKISLNLFLDRLQSATTFAHRLGEGELSANYDARFDNDVLAKSIIQMQQKLLEADERQSKINWVNEGAAQFSQIIKNESEDIASLGDKILAYLVKYVSMNQGALYIMDELKLTRVSTYAYGKKKYVDQVILLGEGLVGQCAIEKQTIYLRQIPSNYVKITSGLGEATPSNLFIVPIKLKEHVLGVIELASFKTLEPYKMDFVERISENIASLIFNKQNVSRTEKLLKESQERAETLAQQEEEMRQNAEELQATQEEMTRQKYEFEGEIVRLKKKLEDLLVS